MNKSFTYQPKFISPDGTKNIYLVPAKDCQQGKDYNWIIVTCSPSYNGIYKFKAEDTKECKMWLNGKKVIYYVPIDKAIANYPLSKISKNDPAYNEIVKQQTKWINGKVKGHKVPYTDVPDWCLEGVKLNKPKKPEIQEEILATVPEEQDKEKELQYVKLWEI